MAENDPGLAPASTDPNQTDEGQGSGEEYSLGNDFLKNIPESDRPIVEKYIKDWDAGVTNKFKEIHQSYAPYKELGELDYVRDSVAVVKFINDQPEVFLKDLARELGVTVGEAKQAVQELQNQGQNPPTPGTPQGNGNEAFQGLPKEFLTQYEQDRQILNSLAQAFVAQNQQSQEAREAEQLETYLSDLKTRLGDFDEDSVLTKMARGMDGEKAAKEWISKYGKTPPPPPLQTVLTGGGAPAGGTQKIADLSRDDTVSLVAQILSQNQGA